MHLRSTDGATMTLCPAGYQFPYNGPPTAGMDTDANWLVIKGLVTLPTGESFAFKDPCLLTTEALELGHWFKEAAMGLIEPTDRPDEDEGLLAFLEPNLAFSVGALDQDKVTLRVHLSLEASPPWSDQEAELFETFLSLRLPTSELQLGAGNWHAELAAYPVR